MPRCSVVSFAILRNILLSAAVILNIACAQTSVRLVSRGEEKNLRPPARILVYEFAIAGAAVIEYQGIMRQQPSIRDLVRFQASTVPPLP